MAAIRILVIVLIIAVFIVAIVKKKPWLLGVAGALALGIFIGGYLNDQSYVMDQVSKFEIREISGRTIEYIDDQGKVNKLYYNQYIPIEIDKNADRSTIHIHERRSRSGSYNKEVVKLVLTEKDSTKIDELKGLKGVKSSD